MPAVAQTLDAAAWQRLSASEGTQGTRLYDWAYLELANLEANEFNPDLSGTWTRGLLIRRSLSDGSLACFTTWCPVGTTIKVLVAVEGSRWAIEDGFETVKTEMGLEHNETRSWHGWHRHVSLAMLASIRHHANQPIASRTPTRQSQGQRRPSSSGRSRRSVAWPRALHSAHPACPCHHVIAPATRASSHRATLTSDTKAQL